MNAGASRTQVRVTNVTAENIRLAPAHAGLMARNPMRSPAMPKPLKARGYEGVRVKREHLRTGHTQCPGTARP